MAMTQNAEIFLKVKINILYSRSLNQTAKGEYSVIFIFEDFYSLFLGH
jgi:predicted nucleic acid-binding protein